MIKSGLKRREEKEANYYSLWINGKTLRFAIDPKKEITELKYPEFYDIKVTGNCEGACQFCYMDSVPEKHYENIIEKTRAFFDVMPKENLPYQVALGGGEPTSHPDFLDILRVLKEEYDICPNYTTNGMWVKNDESFQNNLLETTKEYCGGVAVSCHPHLKQYWEKAALLYFENEIKLNFHIIISDDLSIDIFNDIFEEWKDKVDYFVLLPYGAQGRAKKKEIDWDYLVKNAPSDHSKLAFGANFYPYLQRPGHDFKVSLYPPEIMSKFLDLKDMMLYPSSFSVDKPLN